jgi:hypothetical protein
MHDTVPVLTGRASEQSREPEVKRAEVCILADLDALLKLAEQVHTRDCIYEDE